MSPFSCNENESESFTWAELDTGGKVYSKECTEHFPEHAVITIHALANNCVIAVYKFPTAGIFGKRNISITYSDVLSLRYSQIVFPLRKLICSGFEEVHTINLLRWKHIILLCRVYPVLILFADISWCTVLQSNILHGCTWPTALVHKILVVIRHGHTFNLI